MNPLRVIDDLISFVRFNAVVVIIISAIICYSFKSWTIFLGSVGGVFILYFAVEAKLPEVRRDIKVWLDQ
jgi:hypothetical protein